MEQLTKKIKENIHLRQCQKGDKIVIGRYPMRGGTRYMSGSVIIEKIKPIKNGMVQLKYQSQYGDQNKIHKIDLGGESTVERTRDWVPSDGENAGFYEPTIITIDGIQYRVANPKEMEELPARHERNLKAREERAQEERDRLISDPFMLDPGGYASLFAGIGLTLAMPRTRSDLQLTSDSEMKRVGDSVKKSEVLDQIDLTLATTADRYNAINNGDTMKRVTDSKKVPV